MATTDLIQVGCLLTRAQHAALKALAAQTHVSMSVYLRAAVDELLAKQRSKNRDRRDEVRT